MIYGPTNSWFVRETRRDLSLHAPVGFVSTTFTGLTDEPNPRFTRLVHEISGIVAILMPPGNVTKRSGTNVGRWDIIEKAVPAELNYLV